ncbi:MAG: hypothetical protein GEU90_02455 [Gemmatimonas sp.]|nr:hypothetical protein [Gemmatimonas sp.]
MPATRSSGPAGPSTWRATALVVSLFSAGCASIPAGADGYMSGNDAHVLELDPVAAAWIEETIAELDLRQRVAQLVFPWIPGGAISERSDEFARIRRWIEREEVGGLIVSRGQASEFAPMLNRLQLLASVPLLIVSDLETGPGMRLTGGTDMPPAMAFGAAGDEDLAYEAGRVTAVEARSVGIHMTLGPILDVNSNPLNPIINTRSFGEQGAAVGRLASAWIRGARDGGLQTVGKHFPGHGATELDSHDHLPTIKADLEQLNGIELVPFRAAVGSGLHGILVGHIAVPAIAGPTAPPASLSPDVVTGLLREQLGFDGLVFTDALNMGAIVNNYTVEEAAILALRAGVDVLLQPPDHGDVIDAIVDAVRSGRLDRQRVDEAVRRVLTAKAAASLHDGISVQALGWSAPASHEAVARRISGAGITLARDRARLVPIGPDVHRILQISYSSAGRRFVTGALNASLADSQREIETTQVGERTPAGEYQRLRERAKLADLVIVSASLVPRQSQGPLDLRGGISEFVEGVVAEGIPVLVISFGSPYLLDYFPSVDSYLLGWSGDRQAQRAIADALLGRSPIRGRLPVSLPPHHTVGDGIDRSEAQGAGTP